MSIFIAAALAVSLSAGADECKNLFRGSDDLSNAVWLPFSKNATAVKSDAADPNGKKEAFRVNLGDTGFLGQVIKTADPGHNYVFSAWMKSATGAPQRVSLAGENNPPAAAANFKAFEVRDEWQRIFLVFACPTEGNAGFRFSFSGGDVLVWHPQVEDVTGKDLAEPGDYVESSLKSQQVNIQIPKDAPASGVVQNISCWGDSLTAGAGGKPYTSVLQAAESIGGRTVFNGGVGGQTSAQIKSRFLAAPEKFGDLTIIWAGRNNYGESYEVESDIAEMVSKLKTNRFLVLSILNMESEGVGTGGHAAILALNKDLAAQYPDNYVDIRSVLVEAYDKSSPDDVANHASDVPPKSLRSDGIHLNEEGYKVVAVKLLDTLRAKSWLGGPTAAAVSLSTSSEKL